MKKNISRDFWTIPKFIEQEKLNFFFYNLLEPLTTTDSVVDDQEYLDRAIEEVSSVGMDQIAITAFDHLDMLEMMDDEEQRQMLSAASNLISMAGMPVFLSNHDQDYAMSPMMS